MVDLVGTLQAKGIGFTVLTGGIEQSAKTGSAVEARASTMSICAAIPSQTAGFGTHVSATGYGLAPAVPPAIR